MIQETPPATQVNPPVVINPVVFLPLISMFMEMPTATAKTKPSKTTISWFKLSLIFPTNSTRLTIGSICGIMPPCPHPWQPSPRPR